MAVPDRDAIERGLLDLGMERLPSGVFRGTADIEGSDRRHNVFVALEGTTASVGTPVGAAESVTREQLDDARNPDDKCDVVVVGSFVLLEHRLPLDALPLESVVGLLSIVVHEHAVYGDAVEQRLLSRRASTPDRAALVGRVSAYLDDCDGLLDGRFSVEQFCEVSEAAIDVVGDPEFLGVLHEHALRYSMATWAERSGDLASNPWTLVADRLDAIRAVRGWPRVDLQ